jgi:hypothetical protein
VKLSSSPDIDFGSSSTATYLPLFTLVGKLTQGLAGLHVMVGNKDVL